MPTTTPQIDSISRLDRSRCLFQHLGRHVLRDVAQILRVQRRQQRNQGIALRAFDQPRPHRARYLHEHQARLIGVNLIPDRLSIHWRERFEHECHVGGMHRPQTLVELDRVLTMLQTLQQIAFGTFLAMGERLEDTMSVEHSRYIVEALLKARFRPNGCHRDPPRCVANDNRSVTKAALSRRNDGARVTAAIMEACHPGGCLALSPLVYMRRRGQIDGMCRLRASRRSWNGAPGGRSQRRRIRVNSSDI